MGKVDISYGHPIKSHALDMAGPLQPMHVAGANGPSTDGR